VVRTTTGRADTAAGSALEHIGRGGAANLLGTALGALGQLGLTLITTRVLAVEDAGHVFVVTSGFMIVLALVGLGTDQGVVRHLAAHRARAQGDDAAAQVERADRDVLRPAVVATTSVALAVAVLGAAAVLADVPGLAAVAGEDRLLPLVALGVLPLAAVYQVLLAATRGAGVIGPTVVLERIGRPVLGLALALVAAAAGLGPAALVGAWVAPYVPGAGLAWWAWRSARRAPVRTTGRSGAAHDGPVQLGGFWAFTLPRGVAGVAQVGLQRADVLIVAAVAGPGVAAVYTAATRVLALGQLANTAVQQVAQAPLSALLSVRDLVATSQVLRRTTTWFVLLVWPGYLVLAALAPVLLPLFGPEYVDGVGPVRLLVLALLVATALGPLDVVLLMSGRSVASMVNTWVALGVDVALCLLLVPQHGALGAAAAWATAIVVRNVLSVLQVAREPGMTSWSRPLATACLLAGLLVGVPGALALLLGAAPVWVAVAQAGGLAVYLVALVRLRSHLGLDELARALRSRSAIPE
jgi:O-antigen/teichoic acid export membrane protein